MAIEVRIPKLGLTMTEATLTQWTVAAGQAVVKEKIIAVIETDKISFEIPSPGDGLLHPTVEPGTTVEVTGLIGYVAANEAELTRLQKEHPVVSTEPVKPVAREQAKGSISVATAVSEPGQRIKSSPLARAMAKEHGLDLSLIFGSGPGGRIVRADILKALEASRQPTPALLAEVAPASEADVLPRVAKEIPIKGVRKVIFEKMQLSLSSQAQLTLHTETSVKMITELRRSLNEKLAGEEIKVSFNAILVKGIAAALKQHPNINASVEGETIKIWKQVNIGVAMDLGHGLIVPKVRHADTKSLKTITQDLDILIEKARNNTLLFDDLQGGTFTLTNLGAWDVDQFTPIVNFPESAILGAGRIVEKPWVSNGEVNVDSRMALSLTFDHRIIDGAQAAAFLKTLKDMIENPLLML